MLAWALYRPQLTPVLACGRGDYSYLAAVAQSLGRDRDFGITRAFNPSEYLSALLVHYLDGGLWRVVPSLILDQNKRPKWCHLTQSG